MFPLSQWGEMKNKASQGFLQHQSLLQAQNTEWWEEVRDQNLIEIPWATAAPEDFSAVSAHMVAIL